jgi:alpha-soluble NSF attachment protein
LERYNQIDSSFASSKEFEFLKSIAAAMESGDLDAFTELVIKWDRTNAMDEWKTEVLLKLKKMIDDEASLT